MLSNNSKLDVVALSPCPKFDDNPPSSKYMGGVAMKRTFGQT